MRSVDRDNHTMNEGTADSKLSSRRLKDRCPLNATEIIWKETGPPLRISPSVHCFTKKRQPFLLDQRLLKGLMVS